MACSLYWQDRPSCPRTGKDVEECTVTIAVVGKTDAGKSELISAYTDGKYPSSSRPKYAQVVSDKVFTSEALNCHVRICDTPGDLDFSRQPAASSARKYALMAVYDVNDVSSFERAISCLESHKKNSSIVSAVLVGTWMGDQPKERAVQFSEGKKRATLLRVHYQECTTRETCVVNSLVAEFAWKCAFIIQRRRKRQANSQSNVHSRALLPKPFSILNRCILPCI